MAFITVSYTAMPTYTAKVNVDSIHVYAANPQGTGSIIISSPGETRSEVVETVEQIDKMIREAGYNITDVNSAREETTTVVYERGYRWD